MGWQLPLTLLLVGLAGLYLAWRGWRTWHATRTGCEGGCGCHQRPAAASGETLIPAEKLTVRRSRL